MTTRFDESLPQLCSIAAPHVGDDVLSRSAVIREAAGRLSLLLPINLSEEPLEMLRKDLVKGLGPYARLDRTVANIDEPGVAQLIGEAMTLPSIKVGGFRVHLLDRRMVGADWLRPPARAVLNIPRVVFSSLKGGVGRSTALCVAAAHLSRRGRRVLAIDFDLEAPGIGTMLLNEKELPRFGTLDYFVEAALSEIDNRFLADLSGDSFVGAAGARVTVVPAIGSATNGSPGNALAKIARAYLEVPQPDGAVKSITDQLNDLLSRFEATSAYDIVLIDARAGLHETAASAITGIGAEVLLFGLDQPQTFQSYKLLLGHLAQFSVDVSDDWRERLCFVHAKASDSEDERDEAASRFAALYSLVGGGPHPPSSHEHLTADDFDLEWEHENSADAVIDEFEPPPVLNVLEDAHFRNFDPILDRRILDAPVYASSYRTLLSYLDEISDEHDFEQLEEGGSSDTLPP